METRSIPHNVIDSEHVIGFVKLRLADVSVMSYKLKDNYPIHESNIHRKYFAYELNCVISRFNSTAIYMHS